jgi:hypothetical protein
MPPTAYLPLLEYIHNLTHWTTEEIISEYAIFLETFPTIAHRHIQHALFVPNIILVNCFHGSQGIMNGSFQT